MSTPSPVTFESLGLPPSILSALTKLGYEEPTPIQREAIPSLLAGKDVLGQAATGTGKTAAFALPMLSRIEIGKCKQFETSALVLVPTRELALQVTEAVRKYGGSHGVSVLAVYGGEEIGRQLKPLRKGVDIVVATPGRAIDHLKRKSLLLNRVGLVVLDEADEMLDMGFADDLETILDALPEKHQTALFSATMPSRILKIAERHLTQPVRVNIARTVVAAGEAPKVRQTAYVVPRRYKTVALMRIFQADPPQSALIFCRTRDEVDELASVLIQRGEPAAALHGGLNQEQRDRVMKKFKTGGVKFLVATDVAARGLHIENLTHVVNFDVPNSPEAYVHRIGRTGRAGREGAAITLAEPAETRMLQGLERTVAAKIPILPVPTPDELRNKLLQHTRDAVLAAAKAKTGAAMRTWLEQLTDQDPLDVAAAAIELLHDSEHGGQSLDDVQIPVWSATRSGPGSKPFAASQGGGKPHKFQGRPVEKFERAPRPSASKAAKFGPPPHDTAPERPPRPSAAKAPKLGAPAHEAAPHRPARPSAAKAPKFGAPSHEAAPHRPARPSAARRQAPAEEFDRPPRAEKFPRSPAPEGRRHGPPQRVVRSYEQPEPSRGFARRHDGSQIPKRNEGAGDKIAIWFGAGERAGIRPGDLVGAIANEAQIDSKLIGPIQIKEAFSLVGIPAPMVDRVIAAMEKTTLRGRKVQVRRDR